MATPESLVDAALEYAYPLHAVACLRHRAVHASENPRRHAPNTWRHERELADAATRWITTPNNDTLYSNAWVDLSAGPVTLRAERMPAGRYWSVAVMDAWTNHVAMLGMRLDAQGPASLTLVGPQHTGPLPPGRCLRVAGRDVWLFARCLVEGPQDLPQAHAMQDRLSIEGPAATARGHVRPGAPSDVANFLDVVNEALADNPPPPEDQALLAAWHTIGLRPGEQGVWARLSEDARQAWQVRTAPALAALQQAGMRGRREHQGWLTAGPEIGNFGRNHALRASIAHGGLGALEPTEAMYFVRFKDEQGELLNGLRSHVLRVPPAGLPVDGFWSLSMYQPVEGQRFFVDNPLQRYALGDRTPGLVFEADGSLDIFLGHEAPAEPVHRANWLPAPAGPFQLSLRCYLPRAALRELRVDLPALRLGLG